MSEFSFSNQHPATAVSRMLFETERRVIARERWNAVTGDKENLAVLAGLLDLLTRANLPEAVVERFVQQVEAATVEIALVTEPEEAKEDV